MSKHILFVDNEANVLQGLQGQLGSMRDEWEMVFVEGGQVALDYIASHRVDVLVSGIGMSKRDGAQLLKSVSKQHPGIISMELSGYSGNGGGEGASEPSQPHDPDVLISAIKRSLGIQTYLQAPALSDFVTGIPSLPGIPAVYKAFIDELSNPASTTDTVAATIEQDAALASSILSLANSAYFDLPAGVTGIPQAIEMLGLETMGSLIVFTSLFSTFSDKSEQTEWVDHLGLRSMSIGSLARDIARLEGLASHDIDRACCAGMLLHIGTLILISSYPEGYVRIGEMIEKRGMSIVDAEQQQFSASHSDIGAYLLGLWGISHPVVEAVLYHHAPGTETSDTFSPASAVNAAQGLSRLIDGHVGTNFSDDEMMAALDMDHLQHVGRSDRLPVWRTHIEGVIRNKGGS